MLAFSHAVLIDHSTVTQAALFGLTMLGFWIAELSIVRQCAARKSRRGWVNVKFALAVLPIQVTMTFLCVMLSTWCVRIHWGLLQQVPHSDSPWVRYVAMFLVLDLLEYVYHILMHHVPLCWRVHLVHHTDQQVDVSTTLREHPGETVLRNGYLIGAVLLTGASPEILIIRQTTETISNIISHTSLRLGPAWARIFGWLLVTPNLHHVHHHRSMPYTNRNFGDVLMIWDRLFGTASDLASSDLVIGLDTHMRPDGDHGFFEALSMPVHSRKPTVGAMLNMALPS